MGLILLGLAQSALILLGIGIVSSRFKAGTGLGELGAGITSLVAAPLTGTGTGLSSLAGGIRDISETFGDLGRGLGTLFENIPALPPQQEAPRLPRTTPPTALPTLPSVPTIRPATLITNSSSDLAAGGGIRVPTPTIIGPVLTQPVIIGPGPTLPGFTPKPTSLPVNIYTRNRDIVML